MVERCSNGVAFLVLEPEPSVRTGIRVDIYRGDDPNTLIARLPLTWGRKWSDPLKGAGSGEFWVHADDETIAANPGILDYGNIARFSLDERYRFAIQIEHKDRVQVQAGGDVARTIHVTGRGLLSKLEEAALYPVGGLAGEAVREFTDANPDEILGSAFDEAQTRGALTGLARDFTAARDSNNAPYDVTLTVEERAGNSVLRIAERLAELAGDVYMTTAGVLKFVNQRGIDRSQQLPDAGPVILQPADNLTELTRSEDGAIRNVLLVETPAGFLERSRGDSVSTHGRRETYLSLGNISDGDGVDRAAESVFAQSADPAAQIGSAVLDKDGARPYVDWSVGDWVLAPDEDDTLERFRVRALTVSETAEGEPVFTPELATITEELENRYERWLSAMAKGTVGGTAGSVAEPVKAPREVVTAIDAGIGDHIAGQPHHDELSDLADTDVTGLADDDVLRYNSATGAWEPEALELDALADVDLTTAAPTDGQVLKYDDDSGLWLPANDETGGGGGGGRTLLDETELASAAATIEIGSLSQAFDHLEIEIWARSTRVQTQDIGGIRFGNGSIDSGNNYWSHAIHPGQAEVTRDGASDGLTDRFGFAASSSTSGVFGFIKILVPDYTDTGKRRQYTIVGGGFVDGTNRRAGNVGGGTWASTAAVDVIQFGFYQNGPNIAAGSVVRVYGV